MQEKQPQPEAPRLSEMVAPFLRHAQLEWQFRPQSLDKYRECLRQVGRILGDRQAGEYTEDDIADLKSALLSRGLSVPRQISILSAIKRMLEFATKRGYAVLSPETITMPTRPLRRVVFLSVEEVDRFVSAIPTTTLRGRPNLSGLRFRALVEVLLGSAMRIGEVLSLDRSQIDFKAREARVIGKGDKERTVFFTERALQWLGLYLSTRSDQHPALFVTISGDQRLGRPDIWRPFTLYRRRAGINKPVTPHLLRHTAATQLLFNGCPVGHIKEILGHERLETTCRYYLGLDLRAAKQAHEKFLVYG